LYFILLYLLEIVDVLFDENKVNKDFGKNGVIRDKKQETRE